MSKLMLAEDLVVEALWEIRKQGLQSRRPTCLLLPRWECVSLLSRLCLA